MKVSETIKNDLPFYTKVFQVNHRIDFIEKINATIRNKLKETLRDKTGLSGDEIDYILAFAVAGRIAIIQEMDSERVQTVRRYHSGNSGENILQRI